VEKAERFSLHNRVQIHVRQSVVLVQDRLQVAFSDRIIVFLRSDDRLDGNITEAFIQEMLDITGKIEIIPGKGPSDIILTVLTFLYKILIILRDDTISPFSVDRMPHTVIHFRSAVYTEYDIHHIIIDVIDLFVIQQDAICRDRKADILVIFGFNGPSVFDELLNHFKVEKRFSSKKIDLKIVSAARIPDQKIDGLFSCFQTEQAAVPLKSALIGKAVFTSDVAVMGNVSPVLLRSGNVEEVRSDVKSIMEAVAGHDNFILSTGCSIIEGTPDENMHVLFENNA
jgi:hypothetical protein